MKEINEEVKLTLSLMRDNIDEGAYCELQSHLYSLLEIKRNELQQSLTGGSLSEPAWAEPAKPLTTVELMNGGWWCADVSRECANAFKSKGLRVYNSHQWGDDEVWNNCGMEEGDVTRGFSNVVHNKQIHRVSNDFYWSE